MLIRFKHFGSLQELKLEILEKCEVMIDDIPERLVNLMTKQIGEVILGHRRQLIYV